MIKYNLKIVQLNKWDKKNTNEYFETDNNVNK